MDALQDPVSDLAADLAGVTDSAARELIFLKHIAEFGVCRFAYLNSSPRLGEWYLESNYPTEWVQHYVANNFAAVDVVPVESRLSPIAFQWRAALAKPCYGPEAERVFHDAAAFGIHDGYSVPIHGPGGVALMSLAADDRSLFSPAAQPRLHALQLMSLYYHLACERSLAASPASAAPQPSGAAALPPAPIQLTPRETEVLLWAAKGKTGWEIAHILHLAERTVTYHIENAKAKLGAATRSHAVVKAITLGLICP